MIFTIPFIREQTTTTTKKSKPSKNEVKYNPKKQHHSTLERSDVMLTVTVHTEYYLRSIVSFVQSPRFRHGHPVLIGRVQGHVAGKGGPFEDRRKGVVDIDPVLEQQPAGRPGLLSSIFRQIDVAPSRVLVELVPFRFPVPQQDQCVDAVLSKIGQFKGRGRRVQWCPATNNVADHGFLVAVAIIIVAFAAAPGGHVGSPSSCFLAPGRSPNDHGFLATTATIVFVFVAVAIFVVAFVIAAVVIIAAIAAHSSTR